MTRENVYMYVYIFKDIKRDYKHICLNVKPAFSDFIRRKPFKYIHIYLRKLINFKKKKKRKKMEKLF